MDQTRRPEPDVIKLARETPPFALDLILALAKNNYELRARLEGLERERRPEG